MRRTGIETGRRRELWLALLALAATVLVPTALVLWFMGSAMRNARAAVRVQLNEAYQEEAFAASRQVEAHWAGRIAALDAAAHQPASRIFASCVSLADSAVVYDGARIAYPVREETAEPAADLGPEWAAAGRLEFEMNQPEAAAAAYAQIASESKVPRIRALALLAQARCLIRSGRKREAMAALSTLLRNTEYRAVRDLSGRMIVPNAMLMALLGSDASSPEHAALAKQLAGRLSDYNEPAMPSSQRLFLMESLPPENRTPEIERYIAAEELAAQYAEVSEPPPTPSSLTPTAIAGVWQLGAADGRLVALYRQERVLQESLAAALPEAKTNSRMLLRLFGPGGAAGASPTEIPVVNISAAENVLPGWTLAGFLSGPDPFAEAARREHALYLWTGVVGILLIFALALAITLHLARQMRLTRLKNDLIATVSHELKTPLSSMRVLVDTLLEGRCADRQQEQEYLRLIAGENQRLTRLIDNFLNFSRMERNRHALVFAEVKPAEIVRAAAESVRERFNAPHCRLELDLPPALPAIIADRDALVTVMLNLLDNAWKYSGEEKEVSVRARAGDGELILTVQDNGIGLSPRQMRRIFEPFYQADRSLSRRGGGCGLGLSIVRFIVRAHGGEVEVASAPGKGSTFTVRLPLAGPAEEPEVSAHGS
jgi:signal transduction histidine kinase